MSTTSAIYNKRYDLPSLSNRASDRTSDRAFLCTGAQTQVPIRIPWLVNFTHLLHVLFEGCPAAQVGGVPWDFSGVSRDVHLHIICAAVGC